MSAAAYVLLKSGVIGDFLADHAALIGDAFAEPLAARDDVLVLVDALKQAGVWSVDHRVRGSWKLAEAERDRKRPYSVSLFWVGEWHIAQSITRGGKLYVSRRHGERRLRRVGPRRGWVLVAGVSRNRVLAALG